MPFTQAARMPGYYINTLPRASGAYEVHKAGCLFMPSAAMSHYLGEFTRCAEAVERARLFYRQTNGCRHCSRECHSPRADTLANQ